MQNIFDDWNGKPSGANAGGSFGNPGDLNLSGLSGMDSSSFSLSQVCYFITPIMIRCRLIIRKRIQMQCSLYRKLAFLQFGKRPKERRLIHSQSMLYISASGDYVNRLLKQEVLSPLLRKERILFVGTSKTLQKVGLRLKLHG